jgi:hypothetical protein
LHAIKTECTAQEAYSASLKLWGYRRYSAKPHI